MNKLTQNEIDMFNHLENFDMLDTMLLDYQIFKLNTVWNSAEQIWKKFIRSI